MRYEQLARMMRLAIRLQATRTGLTIEEMKAELGRERRTAERVRNAIEDSFGVLDEMPGGDRRQRRWRLRSEPLSQLIRVAPEELVELKTAAAGLDRAGLAERAKALHGLAYKLRAMWRPRQDGDPEAEFEVLMHTEGLAMRTGPWTRLEEGPLPLLREGTP